MIDYQRFALGEHTAGECVTGLQFAVLYICYAPGIVACIFYRTNSVRQPCYAHFVAGLQVVGMEGRVVDVVRFLAGMSVAVQCVYHRMTDVGVTFLVAPQATQRVAADVITCRLLDVQTELCKISGTVRAFAVACFRGLFGLLYSGAVSEK